LLETLGYGIICTRWKKRPGWHVSRFSGEKSLFLLDIPWWNAGYPRPFCGLLNAVIAGNKSVPPIFLKTVAKLSTKGYQKSMSLDELKNLPANCKECSAADKLC
jgi:hypothetical protein